MRTLHTACIFALSATALAALVSGCGSDNALVGGRCREGLVARGDGCERPGTGPDDVVTSGTEPPELASGVVDPPAPDAPVVDAGAPPWLLPVDAAVPLVPSVVDPLPEEIPEELELVCDAPLVACRDACIPVHSDPLNCGTCAKVCPSNICVNGECQGETPGDVVLVGHDFAEAWTGSAQARVLVNAITIPTSDPVRVLTWEENADAATVAHTKTVVTTTIRGRRVRFTRGTASAVASDSLASRYDVVLLFDGAGATPAVLGASWADSLTRFAQKGGVVIALDGAASDMPALVTATGLLSVPSHTTLPPGSHLVVAAPNDTVGRQVLSPYATAGAAVSFPLVSPPSNEITWVVRTGDDDAGPAAPVVVHRTVR